jgi:hypothetical protein
MLVNGVNPGMALPAAQCLVTVQPFRYCDLLFLALANTQGIVNAMRTPISLLLTLALLLPMALEAEPATRTYANARFGFVLSYPTGLIAGPEPANGAGREFHTKDAEFSILAQGHFLTVDDGDSLEKRWKDELKECGDTVTFKKKTAGWYVVSGVGKNGVEYYTKFFVKRSNWVEIRITYPHARSQKYDPWVTQIEKSFVPFRAGDFDRIQ